MPLGRYCSQNCHLMVPAVNKVSVKLDSCQSAWCFLIPSFLLFHSLPFSLPPHSFNSPFAPCLLAVCPPTHSLPSSLAAYISPTRSVHLAPCLLHSLPCSSPAYLPPTHSVPPSGYFSNSLTYFVSDSWTACIPPTHPLGLSLLISSHSLLHSLLVSIFHNSFLPLFHPPSIRQCVSDCTPFPNYDEPPRGYPIKFPKYPLLEL